MSASKTFGLLIVLLVVCSKARAIGLVVNEILCDPPPRHAGFIELYNPSPEPLDVGGWRLLGSIATTLPEDTVIAGGGYWILAEDAELFEALYGFAPDGQIDRLPNGRAELTVRTASGVFVTRAEYELTSRSPVRGTGASLELRSHVLDGSTPASWSPSRVLGGTPGAMNSVSSQAELDRVVPERTAWRYFKGSTPPSPEPLGWTTIDFDDSSWLDGVSPLGYGNVDDATVLDDMEGAYSTVYLRRSFRHDNQQELLSVVLWIVFDDGFIAYLNGAEIRRGNLGEPGQILPHDGVADERQRLEGVPQEFYLAEVTELLVEGENVLAIHAANDHVRSSDFAIHAALSLLRGVEPRARLLLNEMWLNGDHAMLELFNASPSTIDAGGLQLLGNGLRDSFVVPGQLPIGPGGHETVAVGRELLLGKLVLADSTGREFIDVAPFNFPFEGGSVGRFPDGEDQVLPLPAPTPGEPNAAPLPGEVVITEIHYKPIASEFEFVELQAQREVNLDGWQLSEAVDYTFSESTPLRAGDHLVVARNPEAMRERYGGVRVAGPFRGRLANSAETIVLVDPFLREVDRVRYADDGSFPQSPDGAGPSLELVDPSRENDLGSAWRASRVAGGTPGEENSVHEAAPGPLVSLLEHRPLGPRPGESVVVTARVEPVDTEMDLLYRREGEDEGGSGWIRVPMAARGQMRTATVPPQEEGVVVEFAVEATSPGIPESRVRFPDGVPGSYLYEVSDRADSPLVSTYRLILRKPDLEALEADVSSNVLRPATFVGLGRAFQNVRIRYRGHGSRFVDPKSYRLVFSDDQPFEGAKTVFLNGFRPERQVLGMELWRRVGMPYSRAQIVQLVLNGEFFPHYAQVEPINRAYLDRHFGTDEGNLYRGQREGDFTYLGADPELYREFYEKESNEEEADWSDVIELCRVFTETSDEEFRTRISELIDVENWIRWLAVQTILSNQEGGLHRDTGDDYFVYAVPEDGRFVLLPWDMDSTYLESEERIFRHTVPALRRLATHSAFAPLYFEALEEILDHHFTPRDLARQATLLERTHRPEILDEFVTFTKERRAFIQRSIPSRLTVSLEEGWGTGRELYSEFPQAVLTGTAPVLWSTQVFVNQRQATYTSWTGRWHLEVQLPTSETRFKISALRSVGDVLESREVVVRRLSTGHEVSSFPDGLTQWSREGSPYVLSGNVQLQRGSTLVVESGTEVLLPSGGDFAVDGELRASGEAHRRVIFRLASASSALPRLRFVNEGRGEFRHCEFLIDAEAIPPESPEAPFIQVERGEVVVSSCVFRRIPGVVLEAVDGVLEVTDSSFYDTGEAVHGVRSQVSVLRNLIHFVRGDKDAIDLDEAATGARAPCLIEENTIVGGDDDGIDLLNSSAVVRGNVILGVADRGMSIEGLGAPEIQANVVAGCAGGIALKDGTAAFGDHNTLTDCLIGLHLFVKNPGMPGASGQFHSSIIWGSERDIVVDTDSRLTVDHCDLGVAPEKWGVENFSADPLFFRGGPDFRLLPGSPCVGRGRGATVVGAREQVEFGVVEIMRVVPSIGPVEGGTTVTVEGTGLENVLEIRFGKKPLGNLVFLATGAIRGTAPGVNRYGAVSVEVVTAQGSFVLPEGFRYTQHLRRGDSNGDLTLNVIDAIALLRHLFGGARLGVCDDALDFNGDSRVNLADVVRFLDYLVSSGPPPNELFADCE